MNLLPTLTDKINARACDWVAEGKSGAGSFREGERGRRRGDEVMKEREEDGRRGSRRKMEKGRRKDVAWRNRKLQGISEMGSGVV